MRLGFHELKAHLKNRLSPVYVVTGDEPLQQGEAADLNSGNCAQPGIFRTKDH